jgi:hypothetical protein
MYMHKFLLQPILVSMLSQVDVYFHKFVTQYSCKRFRLKLTNQGANVAFIRFILSFSLGMLLTTVPNAYATDAPILNFGDLLQQPIGPQGLVIAPTAKRMQGQSIRMRGFMVKSEEDAIGQFYFVPMPIQMSEHSDGPANDLPASTVLVKLDSSQASWAVPHKAGPIVLEGTLQVGRHEDSDGTVSWFQLQLPIH